VQTVRADLHTPQETLLDFSSLGELLRAAERVQISPEVRLCHRLIAFTEGNVDLRINVFDDSCRDAADDTAVRHVARHDGIGRHHRVLADRHTGHDGDCSTEPHTFLDDDRYAAGRAANRGIEG